MSCERRSPLTAAASAPSGPAPRPRVVGVIPARWGSTRFPGKSLAPIAGRPLIQRVWERARQAAALDAVLVATDDGRIAEAVARFGGTAVMTRPDHPSGTDRIAEAIRGRPADLVLNIQGDEPFIDPGLINRLAHALADAPRWDMGTAAAPLTRREDVLNPSVVKVVCDRERAALYFSRAPIPYVRDAAPGAEPEPGLCWRHIGLYGYRRAFLETLVTAPPCALEQAEKLEQLRALHLGGKILVLLTTEPGLGVDTPEDVRRAEAFLGAGGG